MISIILFIICIKFCLSTRVAGLASIPQAAHSHCELLYLGPNEKVHYRIEEFLDLKEGNLRINFATNLNPESSQSAYFRLNENSDQAIDHDKVVLYNSDQKLCSQEKLNDWALKGFTRFFELINDPDRPFEKIGGKSKRVFIGPFGALHFIHQNADLFKYQMTEFHRANLLDNHYFSSDLVALPEENNYLEGNGQYLKIIVSVSDRDQAGNESSNLEGTRLSDLETNHQVSLVGIFKTSSEQWAKLKKANASEMFNLGLVQSSTMESLILLIKSVRDISQSMNHVGQLSSANVKSVDWNPFVLPAASGCGDLLPSLKPVTLSSSMGQFSGRFVANSFSEQFYVAYDQESDHLRYDSSQEFKMVYSAGDNRVTMMSTASKKVEHPTMSELVDLREKLHCAQLKLPSDRKKGWKNLLTSPTSMGRVLGMGPRVSLDYLGSQVLDDDLVVHVYEREVSYEEIPALLFMHSQASDLKTSSKYVVNFFFIPNELDDSSQANNIETMFLHRITLTGLNDGRYKTLVSQLDFEEFSWSLALGSDQPMENPAQIFDIIECSPRSAQTKVQLALKTEESMFSEYTRGQFENSLLNRMASKLIVPRANVNQFEVADNKDLFLVDFVLTEPPKTERSAAYLGWLSQIETIIESKSDNQLPVGELVKLKNSMLIEECSLRMSIDMPDLHEIYMFQCPNIGCGYIRNQKWRDISSVLTNQQPNLSMYPRMCYIYLVSKIPSAARVDFPIHEPEIIHDNLEGKSVRLDVPTRHMNGTAAFRGTVQNVRVGRNLMHEEWDKLITTGKCFTTQSKLAPNIGPASGSDNESTVPVNLFDDFNEKRLEIVELKFDKHHSLSNCHQACGQTAFCRSYSFDSEKFSCTLTNLDAKLIGSRKIIVENMVVKKGCKIYSFNQVLRYKEQSMMVKLKPSQFFKSWNNNPQKQPLPVCSLSECAALCHRNELKDGGKITKDSCIQFIYLRSHSLCYLLAGEDDINTGDGAPLLNPFGTNFEYFDELAGDESAHGYLKDLNELEHYMGGKEKVDQARPCERYERDYRDSFSFKLDKKLEFNPSTLGKIQSEGAPVEIAHHVTRNQCLRNCSLVDSNCYAADYFVHTTTGKSGRSLFVTTCHLYHFRSPFSFKLDLLNGPISETTPAKLRESIQDDLELQIDGLSLLPLEKRLYLAQHPETSLRVTQNSMGWHYYYSGDRLYLKRLLAKTNSLHDHMVDHDQNASNEPMDDGTASWWNHHFGGSSNSFMVVLWRILHLSIGLASGYIILIYIVSPRDIEEFSRQKWAHLMTSRRMNARHDSTASQLELNEIG